MEFEDIWNFYFPETILEKIAVLTTCYFLLNLLPIDT